GERSERQPQSELRQTLLAEARIAGERAGLPEIRVWNLLSSRVEHKLSAHEADGILGVEQIEDLADQLHAVVAAEFESLGQANVELREGIAAQRVDVRHARSQVEEIAIAGLVRHAVPRRIRRGGMIAENPGEVEIPRAAIEAAEGDAMPRVGVERAEAGTALRLGRIDALIAHGAQVGLMSRIGDAELVGAGEHVARGVRQCVEALQLEAVAQPRMAAEVHAVVLRLPVAGPDAEAAEVTEAAAASGRAIGIADGRRIARIRPEAKRDVAILDVRAVDVEAEPRIH